MSHQTRRYYTLTDLFYGENIENAIIDATAVSKTVELATPSKQLWVRNEGPNDAYLAFEKNGATETDFLLKPTDGLVKLPVQCAKVSAVCKATETAQVRIASSY